MGFRTILIRKKCKLSYQDGYMIVRNEELKMIHLSEINLIIIESGMVSITSYLINELVKQKIKIIFCDEKHNPSGEFVGYYDNYVTSKRINLQIKWKDDIKEKIWKEIVKIKILNQARVLEENNIEEYIKLKQYAEEVELGDKTQRECLAAKMYFKALFGKEFIRGTDDDINSALDYGYSLILSLVNREVVSRGYLTQLGINHKNEYNMFNFSCDLMEIFRPIIDQIVYRTLKQENLQNYKDELLGIFNIKLLIDEKWQYLSNAISIFIQDIINLLNEDITLKEEGENIILNYEL